MLRAVALSLLALVGCTDATPDGSQPTTFNSRSSGYTLPVRGTIDLSRPDDATLARIVDWNVGGHAYDHPDDSALQEELRLLHDPATRPMALAAQIASMRLDDPAYWIEQQLKYPIFLGDGTRRVGLSIDRMSLRYTRRVDAPHLVDYEVTTILNMVEPELAGAMTGMTLRFPLRPLTAMFETSHFQEPAQIPATKVTDEFLCFVGDGDAVTPYSYFDYLNPYRFPACVEQHADKFLEIADAQPIAMQQQPVYPEYHELFKDGEVTSLVTYDRGNYPWGKRNFAKTRDALVARGFTVESTRDEFDVTLRRTFTTAAGRQIGFTTRVVYRDVTDEIGAIYRDGGLAGAEIVVYNGHSGYGANLFDLFGGDGAGAYPGKKYQIFFLRSCSSFSYAVSNVLSMKALADLDLDQFYVDTLSTAEASNSVTAGDVINTTLKFIEQAAVKYDSPELIDYTYQTLLARMDATDRPGSEAIYTVAGEERNQFHPLSNREPTPAAGVDAGRLGAFLRSFIEDETLDQQAKVALLRRAVDRFGAQVTPMVMELLTEGRESIRQAAASALGAVDLLAEEGLFARLVTRVGIDTSPMVRSAILGTLRSFGWDHPEVEGLFVVALNDAQTDLMELTQLLQHLNGSGMRSTALIEALKSLAARSPGQIFSVAPLLAQTGVNTPDMVALIRGWAEDESSQPYVRQNALRALGMLPQPTPETVAFLEAQLAAAGDAQAIKAASDALVALRPRPIGLGDRLAPLITPLLSTNDITAVEALLALVRVHPSRSPELIAALLATASHAPGGPDDYASSLALSALGATRTDDPAVLAYVRSITSGAELTWRDYNLAVARTLLLPNEPATETLVRRFFDPGAYPFAKVQMASVLHAIGVDYPWVIDELVPLMDDASAEELFISPRLQAARIVATIAGHPHAARAQAILEAARRSGRAEERSVLAQMLLWFPID